MRQMNLNSIAGYIFLVAAGAFTILLTWKTFQKFRLKYFFYYLLFLVFFFISNFIHIIGRYFTLGILRSHPTTPPTGTTLSLSFSLLALPFIIISWYFFIHMLLEMGEKKFRKSLKIVFFVLQSMMVVLFSYYLHEFVTTLDNRYARLSEQLSTFFFGLNLILLLTVIVFVLIKPIPQQHPGLQRILKNFTSIYLIMLPLVYVLVFFFFKEAFSCFLTPIINFLSHMFPVVYIWIFMNKFFKDHPMQPVSETKFQAFFSEHNISDREQEIIQLIVEGKSNRTISDDLYISIKTVKAHVYNIYRKLNINSRWQLINLIHNSDLE